jgi:hypothetical protein
LNIEGAVIEEGACTGRKLNAYVDVFVESSCNPA